MSKILVIAEHNGSSLNSSTAKCLTCANEIPNAEIDVVIFAVDGINIANEAAQLNSVNKVLLVNNATNQYPLASIIAPQLIAIADGYSHLLGPSTTFGKDLMPRVAALLGVNQISDVMAVLGSHKFRRPIYAGNAILTVEAPTDRPLIATVRTASFTDIGTGNSAMVKEISVDIEIPNHTRFIKLQGEKSDRPDLQTARKVVSGGRALGSSKNFDIIFKLADSLGAGAGASRAAVDAGYVPNDMQVGQTGKIIAPELYIAIGISGAIQHLTGIKDAGTIVAINKDEDAPIFEVADIGLIGDLFEVVPKFQEIISS